MAAASPSGNCLEAVDGERQGPGFSGDIADESHCRAKCRRGLLELRVDQPVSNAYRLHQQAKRHHRGSDHGALPGEGEHDAKRCVEPVSDWTTCTEQQQEGIAGYDRRQDHRQLHEGFDKELAAEIATGQQPANERARWNADQRGPRRDPGRESQRRKPSEAEL